MFVDIYFQFTYVLLPEIKTHQLSKSL